MKINNNDISIYSAELIDRRISTSPIVSETHWNSLINGVILNQKKDFKVIELTFLVRGENEDDAFKKIDCLTAALVKSDLVFDDINLTFSCVLDSKNYPTRCAEGIFKVIYTLKNDKAVGEEVSLSFEIPTSSIVKINLKYIDNMLPIMGHYADCFDEDEYLISLANEIAYIDKSKITTIADDVENWTDLFLGLGIDINKYKPKANNTLYGFVDIATEYSPAAAATLFDTQTEFTIYYNRFQKDGIPDFPIGKGYPNKLWHTDADNSYYFDLGVGEGLNPKDLSYIFYGRNFQTNTSRNGAGNVLGDNSVTISFKGDQLEILDGTTVVDYQVLDSKSSTSNNIIITTISDASGMPIRKYGLENSIDKDENIEGYFDVYVNGGIITRKAIDINHTALTSNIFLLYSSHNLKQIGTTYEIARVQIKHKGKVIRDVIPICGNVKNGFYNDWDCGLYDINTMEFIPWIDIRDNTIGPKPNEVMTIPVGKKSPTPPIRVPKHTLTINSGSGSGVYEEGAYVTITANPAPEGQVFKEWVINSGTLSFDTTKESITLIMPTEDCEITATYQEQVKEIYIYRSINDIDSETTMGENKIGWATSTSGPSQSRPVAYDTNDVAVISAPNVPGTWSVYNASYINITETGTDKWGRAYAVFNITAGKGKTGQYFTFTPTDGGTEVVKDFCIRNM